MFPSLLTVFLFALSGIAGGHTARRWGAMRGNALRLGLAALVMGVITLLWFPESLDGEVLFWLLISGVIGFGFGDIALFMAYARVGARLAVLLNLCSAPLWAAALEMMWLGTRLSAAQSGAAALILAGVAVAVASREPTGMPRQGSFVLGVVAGVAAGLGQGVGAVFSRRAIEVAEAGEIALNGFSAAAQRVAGGLLPALLAWGLVVWLGRGMPWPRAGARVGASCWLLAATLAGPVLGVSAFQWALAVAPSALVLAVVATTPVAMIPMAVCFDRERPGALSVAGAVVAVAGVILLLRVG